MANETHDATSHSSGHGCCGRGAAKDEAKPATDVTRPDTKAPAVEQTVPAKAAHSGCDDHAHHRKHAGR